jgi:hypothetical protein
MNTNTKKGRGRPSGGVSFTNMTLAELNARFDQNQVIPVGRVFLENGNKFVITKQPSQIIQTSVVSMATPQDSTIEMTLSE